MRQEFLKDKPLEDLPPPPIGSPVAVGREYPETRSVAPVKRKILPPGRGTIVTDRLVRVLPGPQGKWTMAHLVSDNNLNEPPIPLLPCSLLEKAEELSKIAPTLRITGRLTFWRGRRFLLLRKVHVERDMGRL